MAGARVAIGVPIHNGARHLRQALDSLLAQTRDDFRVVLVDDGSRDGSAAIAAEYVACDRRFALFRNDRRTGLVSAWRRVAELARETVAPRYFAWFSDHDWVARDWLEYLVGAVDEQAAVVLAHARTVHVDVGGAPIGVGAPPLDTVKMDRYEALRAVTLDTLGAGDAVYGLCRFDALDRCGIFPREILPDRLLVSELALSGSIAHVPAAVRVRRVLTHESLDVIRRQLTTLWLAGEGPVRPHLSHATYFIRRMLDGVPDEPTVRRMERLYHGLLYFQRQFNKYRVQCVQELDAAEPLGELEPLVDFLHAVRNRKWRFLYQDYAALAARVRDGHARLHEAERRIGELKALRDELEAKVAELETRNAALTERLWHSVRHLIRSAGKAFGR